MCNLYSSFLPQEAIRRLFASGHFVDRTGNLPPLPEIWPDRLAPILHPGPDAGELVLAMARWGMPTPPQYLVGKKTDRGVTNIRNTRSAHWRRWLMPGNRCLVPVTRFAEPGGKGRGNVWFTVAGGRPAFFAGLWVPGWTSVRKMKDGKTTDDLFGFLTTEPNAVVAPHHPRAMPVILTEPADWQTWLRAPWTEARVLQRPLEDELLELIEPEEV